MTTETSVRINTLSGKKIAGLFCHPDGVGKFPAVLLCQGLSGVKHLVLPGIAEALAAHGYASLRFDYRGYGESEGERGWIDPAERVRDASDAFAWLAANNIVDSARLAVYGHSYGGPVAISLASRERLARAVVSVSGPGDGLDLLRACRPAWDWVELKRELVRERQAIADGAEPTVVPISTIFPFSPAFEAAYAKLKASQGGTTAQAAGDGLGTSAFYLASIEPMLDFHPSDAAARLGPTPLLMIHGEDDDTAPIETVIPVFNAASGPKQMHVVPGADHNYLDSEGIPLIIERCSQFFAEQLS